MTDTEYRDYWIGLPVGLRVHDDGTVEWMIDDSEAGSGLLEEAANGDFPPPISENRALLDSMIVDAQPSPMSSRTRLVGAMRCNAARSCGFLATGISEMAGHLESEHGAEGDD